MENEWAVHYAAAPPDSSLVIYTKCMLQHRVLTWGKLPRFDVDLLYTEQLIAKIIDVSYLRVLKVDLTCEPLDVS